MSYVFYLKYVVSEANIIIRAFLLLLITNPLMGAIEVIKS